MRTEKLGTQIGTAHHQLMAFFDIEKIKTLTENNYADFVASELVRVTNDGQIDSNVVSDKNIADMICKNVTSFWKSDMGKEVLSAKKVYRESPFEISIPAYEYDNTLPDENRNEQIILQGIIDLYFEDKNGDIILVDYKTDKCTSKAEQLTVAKKYEKQLILYARAMEKILKKIGTISSFASRYIGIIIIVFSCLAFFWRDGFAWMTNYTSVFLGVIMFGMGLTIRMEDFRAIFSRPKEVVIGAVAQYTIMPVIAWLLCKVMNLPADLALGVILVGCCPGGTASNVITYIAGGDVALSVGMTIVSTLAAPLMTPFLVYVLAGAWVEVSFWAMVLSVVKVILVPVLLGVFLRSLAGEHVDKVSDVMPLVSVVAIVMIIGGIVAVNAEKIVSCGVLVLGVVAIHNFCGMMLGLLAAKIFHVEYTRTTAIAIEVGMQNSGLAVSLAAANFVANPLATLPGAIFSVWHNIAGSIFAGIRRSGAENQTRTGENGVSAA